MTDTATKVSLSVPDSEIPHARIAHAVSIQLVCRVLGMLASVFSVAMTARYLGPGRYGQLTIAIAFVGMFTSLADLGTGTVVVRRVTSGRGDLERLVRVNSALSLVYCVPLAALATVAGLLVYRDADVRIMLVVSSAQLLMLTLTTRFEPIFQTTVRFSAVALSDVVSRLATLGAVAWLVATHHGVIWFAVAQLIPPALQLAIQGIAAARHVTLRPAFAPREAADLLRESLPLLGVMVIGVLYWRADGVIVSLVSTHAEVGVYGLAYTIAFNTEALSVFFLKSTLSTATSLFARDVSAFNGFLRRSVELMSFLAVPVAVVGALLAGPLVKLFGEQEYVSRGAPTLALLFVAVALRFVTGTLGQGLFACHQQKFFFRCFVVCLSFNVALNLLLDSHFGAVGAGASLVCTELFGFVVTSWWLHRTCGYRTPTTFMLRLALPVAASAVVVLTLSGYHVLLILAAAAIVYLAVNMAIGPVDWSSLTSLRRKQVFA
ncbi:flippase [Candidatus Mycobacterium wuenschmannii]|uniref:Flippase n=1 Tax=Candidatus Mycobacterium wuenschmannii TaxID=3027808 RepID=A0ABY8VRM6_9MYCO|nr:flippase [Candidatus Mycobacterium wuenschmannii]WIM85736.1 flippase [Candidatus Mycobacterium wuenschmannii]